MISFRSFSNKEKTWTFSLRNETWEDCPTLQISYARAQRETQGAPQTLPFVFFWGRPIKMSLFKKLSGKWTSLHWMWVCWTWGKLTFPYLRSEHSKKWNHFQHLKTLGLMCLGKVCNRESRSIGSCLLLLVAMRCTLENQVISENESDVLIHSSFSMLMSWAHYII